MYVIGTNCCDYIAITKTSVICGCEVWAEIIKVEYDAPIHDSTIIVSWEDAKKTLQEIRNRVDEIRFQNYSILGELIDRKNSFNKKDFVKELKIFELVPSEVTE